jgi:hypothetical protein
MSNIVIGKALSDIAMIWVLTRSTGVEMPDEARKRTICCDGTNVQPISARLSWTNYSSTVPPSERPRFRRLLVLQRFLKTMSTAFAGEAHQALVCATVAPRSSLTSHPDTLFMCYFFLLFCVYLHDWSSKCAAYRSSLPLTSSGVLSLGHCHAAHEFKVLVQERKTGCCIGEHS